MSSQSKISNSHSKTKPESKTKSASKTNSNLEPETETRSKSKSQSASSTVKIKKTSLAGLIIALLILVALIAGAIGGVAVYFIANQTKMSDWAETYLAHIKSVRSGNDTAKSSPNSTEETKIWTNPDSEPKVSFYESRDNTPMMLVNYTSVENNTSFNSVAVYSIQNEEIYLLNYENTNLYYAADINIDIDADKDTEKDLDTDADIEIKPDDYGLYLKSENASKSEDTYINIDDYFQDPEAEDPTYETTCSTDETAENFCGDMIAAEQVDLPNFSYTDNMTDKELTVAVAETSANAVTEELVQEQTSTQIQQSITEAKERIEEKNKIPETFTVGNKTLRFGKYETVDDTGRSVSKAVAMTLNPDMTATYTVYDYNHNTHETIEHTVTTPFEVRPIRNGDVLQTGIGCVAADGGACFNNTLNGQIAIIVLPDGVYNKYNQSFLVTHEAPSDSSKRGGPLPNGCDFEPAAGVQYICYRFLGE